MATDVTPEIRLLTAEQFMHRPDRRAFEELVRGRIATVNPPNRRHGQICARVVSLLQSYLDAHDVGQIVCNDAGVITRRDPDSVRGADVAFYSYARLPKGPFPEDYGPEVPELVVEVRSPSDRWPDVLLKVSEYLAAGVSAVLVLEGSRRSLRVYRPDGRDETLGPDDDLTLPEILGEFRVRVSAFFD